MKRYGNLFLFPFIIIISITFFFGYGSKSNPEMLKGLLMERTSILQQAYYGQIQTDKAENLLAQIETQPLLGTDIHTLRNSEPMEMEMVVGMEIKSLKQIKKLYRYLTFRSEITWYMKGMNTTYSQTVDYHVVLQSVGSNYKLSEFNPIQTFK
jgi:hypothetical protein